MATDALSAAAQAELVAAYARLRRRLQELVLVARARGNVTTFLEDQLRNVERALLDASQAETAFLSNVLVEQYATSASAAALTLEAAGVPILEGSFTALDRRAVRAIQDRVSQNLGSVRDALTDALALGQRGPTRRAKALAQALAGESEFVRVVGGQLKVVVPSGRFWDIEAYSRMLQRTAVADARRVSFRQRYLQNGVDVVKVVANGTTHDVCARWEGESLSLTGATPGLPTVADARASGLFHPNCRHRYVVDTDALQEDVPTFAGTPAQEPAFSTLGQAPSRAPLQTRTPTTARV